MGRKYNILLFGHCSHKNRGCEAIVTSTARKIKKANRDNKITIATFDRKNDKNYHKDIIDNYIAHRWKNELTEEEAREEKNGNTENILQKEVLGEIQKNDICMSIGGDNYCYKDNLGFLYTINKKVKKENKKLVLWCASINEDVVDEEFLKDIRRFDLIFVRESLTFEILSKYVDQEKLFLQPDPAFSLEAKKVKLPEAFDHKEGVVGLNISPLILGYQGQNADVVGSVRKLIDNILNFHPYRVALLPHVYLDGGNDLDILKEIKKIYSENKRVFLMDEKIYDCQELKHIISKCRFLVAARTHASIAGYSAGVPTLVLGYSIKSKGIAKDIFGDYFDYVLPVQDLLNEDILVKKFENLLKNENKIKKILSQKMPGYREQSENLFKTLTDKIENLEKINVTKKEKCSGCGACANSCPEKAIVMKEDSEGFPYPIIDLQKCVDCGICRKICPNNKDYAYKYDNLSAYACKSKFEEERIKSSSGGIFSLLAKSIIKQNGCVFGAAYADYEVRHIKIENENGLEKLRGSKYAESSIDNCYIEAKKDLEKDKKVLFSGTPCQIEGLRNYLRKNYANLYCVSVICHGVPSKKAFSCYLKELEKKYNDKLIKINFRNKNNGWKNYQIEYIFENSTLRNYFREDKYMVGFLRNYFLRQSCYDCDFRLFKKNTADIILGDFWGIENEHRGFNDDKGTSAVIVNSEKGADLFEKIDDETIFEKSSIRQIEKNNLCLKESVSLNKNRFEFFDIFNKMDFAFSVDYFMKKDDFDAILNKLRQTEERLQQVDNEFQRKEEQSRQDKNEFQGLQKECRKFESELLSIINSRKWRVVKKIADVFNSIFPHGSFRRKFLRMGYKGLSKILSALKS